MPPGHGPMELRHLRYFVAVAEAGAFSRAATRLGLTQPALSRQVRDLEVELGVRLFERAGRRVSLTSDGEGLLQRIMPAYAKAFIDEITAYTRRTYPGRQYDRRAPPVPRPRP
jgi:DNA-binding transcriptional LysR family regulator